MIEAPPSILPWSPSSLREAGAGHHVSFLQATHFRFLFLLAVLFSRHREPKKLKRLPVPSPGRGDDPLRPEASARGNPSPPPPTPKSLFDATEVNTRSHKRNRLFKTLILNLKRPHALRRTAKLSRSHSPGTRWGSASAAAGPQSRDCEHRRGDPPQAGWPPHWNGSRHRGAKMHPERASEGSQRSEGLLLSSRSHG